MAGLIQFFKKIILRADNENETQETVEELRAAFKFRYGGFRRVLTANTKALDIMNDIENALLGHLPLLGHKRSCHRLPLLGPQEPVRGLLLIVFAFHGQLFVR